MKPIDQLSPEELREIALSMGWKLERRENTGLIPGQHDWWTSPDGEREGPNSPNYPADANAALTLTHALADYEVAIHKYTDHWHCVFKHRRTPHVDFYGTAPTFSLALCRAYIAVIRSESKP